MANIDVMNEVESPLFSAEMNLAAGKKAFSRNMQEHPLFGQLREFAKTPEGRTAITKRVSELAAQSVDTQYENPNDVAFSAYLTILGETAEPELVAQASSAVMAAPNCSWAVGVSRELLTHAFASGAVFGSRVVSSAFPTTTRFVQGQTYSVDIVHWIEAMKQPGNLTPELSLKSLVNSLTGRSTTSASGNADQSHARSRAPRRGRGRFQMPQKFSGRQREFIFSGKRSVHAKQVKNKLAYA